MLCVGLFGTCGTSTWRKEFMKKYHELGIIYFNPQVENWSPDLAEVEAQHLVDDDIILFPVTDETYATGSLSETGFSILQAVQNIKHRSIVVMIDENVQQHLNEQNALAFKESVRARKLVKAHLSKLKLPNVYVVESLNDMLQLSITLYQVHSLLNDIKNQHGKKGEISNVG